MTPAARPAATVRHAIIHAFIVLSFLPTLYTNFITPAGLYPRPIDPGSPFARQMRRWLDHTGFRVISRCMGGNTTWRMYSPSWKHSTWFDWYAKRPDGAWVAIPTENLSPAYWQRRDWFQKSFVDCKEAITTSTMVSMEPYRHTMAAYMCREVARTQGWTPGTLRLVRNDQDVPPPREFTGWSPFTSPVDRRTEWSFACE